MRDLRRRLESAHSVIGPICIIIVVYLMVGLHNLRFWQVLALLLAAGAAGAAMILVPRKTWARLFAKHFGWVPAAVGLATWPYWRFYAEYGPGVPASIDFFSAAAQVLPVLLLASVVDVRRSTVLQSHQLAVPIMFVILGEIAALDVAAFHSTRSPDAMDNEFATVSCTIVAAVLSLVFAVLADADPQEGALPEQSPPANNATVKASLMITDRVPQGEVGAAQVAVRRPTSANDDDPSA